LERVEGQPPDPQPRATSVAQFLVRYVKENPGVRFGPIVKAARTSCRISLATATRHLARSVRFGEIVLLPDHTYIAGDSNAPPGRPILEVRWFDMAVVIYPDGSSRGFTQREFRVVSGEISYAEFAGPKRERQLIATSTMPSRLVKVSSRHAHNRRSTHRLEFAKALNARDPSWQRICVNVLFPKFYRMERSGSRGADEVATGADSTTESESVEIPSQSRLFGSRLIRDARLRLQVVLPEGYPIGPVRCRVRFLNDPDRFDVAEEARMAELAKDEWSQDGLRRFGTTFTLSVPYPQVDKAYQIVWTLPIESARKRWLASRSREAVP
jgi:hypothetical protein